MDLGYIASGFIYCRECLVNLVFQEETAMTETRCDGCVFKIWGVCLSVTNSTFKIPCVWDRMTNNGKLGPMVSI